jgi:uncharacterized protein YaaR (DUF327 family)
LSRINDEINAVSEEIKKSNKLITIFTYIAPEYAKCRRDPKFAERLIAMIKRYQSDGDLKALDRSISTILRYKPSVNQIKEFMSHAARIQRQDTQTKNRTDDPRKGANEAKNPAQNARHEYTNPAPRALFMSPEVLAILRRDGSKKEDYQQDLTNLRKYSKDHHMDWYKTEPSNNHSPGPSHGP